jgi:hypothetical protein
MLRLLCDYIGVAQFGNYMFSFLLRRVSKNFSHFSSIDVRRFILRRWCIVCAACGTVWSVLGGSECEAGGFVVVCVGTISLSVEKIK